MKVTLNAKDQQKKWTITDDTIYYKDKEIKISSITKMRYEPITPHFKTGKITIYCGEEFSDPIYNLLYDKTENSFGEQAVEFILIKAFNVKKSKLEEEKEKIKISKSGVGIGCISIIIILIVLGIIIYSITTFGPARTPSSNNQTHQNHECYVCGNEASLKYGSHYYCDTHWAMVKTIDEAD